MKFIVVLLTVVIAVVSVYGQDEYGVPTRKCPPGEHSVLYCPQAAEPSCDNPTVHELPFDSPDSGLCDVPQCFCNTPTVRDTKTGKCVQLSKCKL